MLKLGRAVKNFCVINKARFQRNFSPPKFAGKVVSFALYVDGQEICGLIENAAKASGFRWIDSSNVILCLEELHRSVEEDGDYAILTGSHCLMNGIRDPNDINLAPIQCRTNDDFVRWHLNILNLGAPAAFLCFVFHRPQLARSIEALPLNTLLG